MNELSRKSDDPSQPGITEILYEYIDDSDTPSPSLPLYVKYTVGGSGPWMELYKADPRVAPPGQYPLPDMQLHLDFYEGQVNVRLWKNGLMRTAGTDDVDPSFVFVLGTQRPAASYSRPKQARIGRARPSKGRAHNDER